ncbi:MULTISPECIES: alpha-amylase family glycosyl hydrolase [unclassified Sphingomonas]|uniref:alpha-amylase family glycosyl hydrolase n=1 Tax=unclassified Sphingomonas TaxID=196159 RepID=UPI00082A263E|nr:MULTISPECIES: alpha-amylase family glycosyl hydrolase [unclassified Sphingomonas]
MTRTLALMLALAPLIAAAPAAAQDVPARYTPRPFVQVKHPEWSKNATIYQLNTRQFTREGTFAAATRELPRIKALGADIIWLMPIHPIGEKNRKGTLGSPYAVRDYRAVNPEFGDMADFKQFVDAAHKLGMKVILDWVANHSAWDNALVREHPDWYVRDWKGDFMPTPWFDWSDIIDFDYSKPGLRQYMTEAMAFWVREAGVDGFRCDVAGAVPVDFWENARAELDAIKPVFMLAEAEDTALHARAFDASYGWSWANTMKAIGEGHGDVGGLYGFYSANSSMWPHDAMRLMMTENHDFNSWDGTAFERLRDAQTNAIVLSVVGAGIPMIYNGQEAGNQKRLEFFERDPIMWRDHPNAALFRRLFALKHANRALWNADWGGAMVRVVNSQPARVFSFTREKDGDKVFAALNFSGEPQTVSFTDGPFAGDYVDFDGGAKVTLAANATMTLQPWSYRVLVKGGR